MLKSIVYGGLFLILINCKDNPKDDLIVPDVDTEIDTDDEVENAEEIGQWQAVLSKDGSEPVQRHEAAFVRVDSKFYLVGGRSIRAVSIFDTQTETWSLGAEPPIELHHFQPIVIGTDIYVIGALTGGYPSETPTTHIYRYDSETDVWSQGDEIPQERRRGSTGNVLHNGKVYIACGIKNGHIGDHKNWMDRYDPATGEWEILADAPRARDHFQAVLANDKIVAAAGRTTGIVADNPFEGTIGEADVYDIASDSWQTVPNEIPTQRAGTAALFFEGKVLIAGGESMAQLKAHKEVETLDLTTNEWKTLPPLLEGRHGTGLLEYEEALYIASGCGNRGGTPELFTTEKFEK